MEGGNRWHPEGISAESEKKPWLLSGKRAGETGGTGQSLDPWTLKNKVRKITWRAWPKI